MVGGGQGLSLWGLSTSDWRGLRAALRGTHHCQLDGVLGARRRLGSAGDRGDLCHGRRFEIWEQLCQAIAAATTYWGAHWHPFIWGRHRWHRSRRQAGIAVLPKVAQTCRMYHIDTL